MAKLNQHRVYIPTNARTNHYLLCEITPNQQFYDSFTSVADCYNRIARNLFASCDEYELHNVHFLANDKLPVVRYHDEAYQLETQQHMLFFYDPRYHEAHKSYFNLNQQSKKLHLLFLATGTDLRANSAQFHRKVQKVLNHLQDSLFTEQPRFKVRDHQHLTYDIFASHKGHKQSYGYKLRSLYPRYQARHCDIPTQHAEITYATFTINVSRNLKTQFQAELRGDKLQKFYEYFCCFFEKACLKNSLTLAAMVANDKTPIIRNTKSDNEKSNSELQKISFDTESQQPQFNYFYNNDVLVDSLHFVIAATNSNKHDMGYGKFMNQVENVIKSMAEEIAINKEKQALTVRCFQHINYHF